MSKFMQSLGDSAYVRLRKIAEDRDITVQELIRAIVIPDWLKMAEKEDGMESQSERHRRRATKLPKVAVVGAIPNSRPRRR